MLAFAVAVGVALFIFRDTSFVQSLYGKVLSAVRVIAWVRTTIMIFFSLLMLPSKLFH